MVEKVVSDVTAMLKAKGWIETPELKNVMSEAQACYGTWVHASEHTVEQDDSDVIHTFAVAAFINVDLEVTLCTFGLCNIFTFQKTNHFEIVLKLYNIINPAIHNDTAKCVECVSEYSWIIFEYIERMLRLEEKNEPFPARVMTMQKNDTSPNEFFISTMTLPDANKLCWNFINKIHVDELIVIRKPENDLQTAILTLTRLLAAKDLLGIIKRPCFDEELQVKYTEVMTRRGNTTEEIEDDKP